MDLKDKELLLKISQSPILNGGYEKLTFSLEQIKQDLQEFKTQTQIDSQLRNKDLEEMKEEISDLKKSVSEIKDEISNPNTGLIVRVNHTDSHVSRIEALSGGKDLVELQDSIRIVKGIKKYVWALVLATIGSVATVISKIFFSQ